LEKNETTAFHGCRSLLKKKKVSITHRYGQNFGEELARECENMPDLFLAAMLMHTHKKHSEK